MFMLALCETGSIIAKSGTVELAITLGPRPDNEMVRINTQSAAGALTTGVRTANCGTR